MADKTQKEKIREHLEANFLDGDKINDCGGVTFSVDGALDIAEYFYDLAIKETEERLVREIESYIPKFYNLPVNQRKCVSQTVAKVKTDFINLIRNK